uniref:dimethylarginine dimethylaminohydrolase family protein n=2 Tax=Roseivirga sp. TaxID=1964215 RepID=UPI00404754FC
MSLHEKLPTPFFELNVTNETDRLESVILGIGTDLGKELDINPTSKWHIEQGTYPTEKAIQAEIKQFEEVLLLEGVEVLRPNNIPGTDQIFTRDIGFVIDDVYVIARMHEEVRQQELPGIAHITGLFDPTKIITPPQEATIEGGDVVLYNDFVFVGISARTNYAGYEFIKAAFPKKNVYPIHLRVSDDRMENILHLDCTFQPLGRNEAIIYEKGFSQRPDILFDLFHEKDLIKITHDQLMRMVPNIFSIAPDTVVVESSFKLLTPLLKSKGYKTYAVDYHENAKLSGLLRCSTQPLRRRTQ